jgi:hypothetical protein
MSVERRVDILTPVLIMRWRMKFSSETKDRALFGGEGVFA